MFGINSGQFRGLFLAQKLLKECPPQVAMCWQDCSLL